MLCAFQNLHVRMAWNMYMHVDCQNLTVYKAQYTRKGEDTVFKTKYCSSYLYTNSFVGIDRNQNVLRSIPIFVGFRT